MPYIVCMDKRIGQSSGVRPGLEAGARVASTCLRPVPPRSPLRATSRAESCGTQEPRPGGPPSGAGRTGKKERTGDVVKHTCTDLAYNELDFICIDPIVSIYLMIFVTHPRGGLLTLQHETATFFSHLCHGKAVREAIVLGKHGGVVLRLVLQPLKL